MVSILLILGTLRSGEATPPPFGLGLHVFSGQQTEPTDMLPWWQPLMQTLSAVSLVVIKKS